MKKKTLISAISCVLAAAFLVAGCGPKENTSSTTPSEKQPTEKPTKIRVRLTWLYQASYAPFIVAKEKGFYSKHGLDVEVLPSGPDLRPITPVASGEDQIGVEGASAIIQAAANKVPIVVIGTYLQKSAEVFMVRKSDHLDDVKSWKGKKVGVWVGTHVEPLLYAMLAKAGLTKNDVEVVPAKFDIVPFLQDGPERVPIWNAYIYNEAQIPSEKGIEVDVMTPESLGIERAGEGIFASRSFVEKNPEVVKEFVAATIEGIRYTVEHQDEAIQILTSGRYGGGFDLVHQKNMLKAAAPLMLGDNGKPLDTDVGLWEKTVATSFDDGKVHAVDIKALVRSDFVSGYYAKEKK